MAPPGTIPANPRIAYAELETLHRDAFAWALSRCRRSRADAADLLQESYARLLEGSARFEGRSSLRSFVFGVIERLAREQRRNRRVRALLLGRFGEALAPEPAPEPTKAADDAAQQRIHAALRSLSPRQRDVLELVFFRDCSLEEAAGILGIPVGTARTHYQRGKDALAVQLGDLA
jgi:RNA polymerase sigma-70 factor (ECF subfamily)